MYDPEDDQDPQVQEALGAAKHGKYGADEGEVSRFAEMAGKKGSGIKQPPPSRTIGTTLNMPNESHADPTQAEFGPDNPGALADHHEAQAELYKPQMGDVANPADDTPSPTIAQAQGTGQYGDKGASAQDIMSMMG